MKDHAKEHKGRKGGATPAKSQPKRSLLPPPKDQEKEVKEVKEAKEVKETPSRKRKRSGDNLDCYNCGKECKSKSDLKHHVLSHFYSDFYAKLPSSKPFSCPVCASVTRDRISLVRHYAFVHEEIYKYCSKEQLTNSKGEVDISEVVETVDNEVEEVVEEAGDPFAGISDPFDAHLAPTPPGRAPTPPPSKYRPGPKSKKQKLTATSPKAAPSAPPPFRDETHDAEDEKEVVNLSDSDEDSAPAPPPQPTGVAPSFDDLFGGGKVFSMAPPAAQPVVFNKDSDDEGEAMESVAASVGELLGDSDDDIFS